jgi:hypothetical protein
MLTATKQRLVFTRERDLVEFARSYLSGNFPNPERKGCPPDDGLKILARRPTESDESLSNHFTCCSPCFDAYMAHLAQAKAELVESERIRRATWIRRSLVTAGVLTILVIAFYVFFNRRHIEATVAPPTQQPVGNPTTPLQGTVTAMYVQVPIDLSNASPVRGPNQDEGTSSQRVIPSSPLINLKLLLPLGSEETRYSVRLSYGPEVVWSALALAHPENGQMLLQMHSDFSDIPPGNYDLLVVSKGGRLTVPVLVKSAWSGRIK